MKSIYDYEYRPNMGILIDLRTNKPNTISYDKLLMNYKTLLDKNKRYFIICDKGTKSKKAARILSFYGYDVTYIINA